jgi:hypothetical protein
MYEFSAYLSSQEVNSSYNLMFFMKYTKNVKFSNIFDNIMTNNNACKNKLS